MFGVESFVTSKRLPAHQVRLSARDVEDAVQVRIHAVQTSGLLRSGDDQSERSSCLREGTAIAAGFAFELLHGGAEASVGIERTVLLVDDEQGHLLGIEQVEVHGGDGVAQAHRHLHGKILRGRRSNETAKESQDPQETERAAACNHVIAFLIRRSSARTCSKIFGSRPGHSAGRRRPTSRKSGLRRGSGRS